MIIKIFSITISLVVAPEWIEVIKKLDGEKKLLLGLSCGADSLMLLLILIYRREIYAKDFLCIFIAKKNCDIDRLLHKTLSHLADKKHFHLIVSTIDHYESLNTFRQFKTEEFFKHALLNNCSAIVTGHNKNDLIESILMRSYNGSGPYGVVHCLSEKVAGYINLIRPMLHISRERIEEIMKDIPYFTDPENESGIFERNRLRQLINILPYFSLDFSRIVLMYSKLQEFYSYLHRDINTFMKYHGKVSRYNFCQISKIPFLQLNLLTQMLVLGNCISFVWKKTYMNMNKLYNVRNLLLEKKSASAGQCSIRIMGENLLIYRDNLHFPERTLIEENYYLWDNRFILLNYQGKYCQGNTGHCIGSPCGINIKHQICKAIPMITEENGLLIKDPAIILIDRVWFQDIPRSL